MNGLTLLIIVAYFAATVVVGIGIGQVAIAQLDAQLEDVDDNQTLGSTDQESANSGTEQMGLKAQLKPDANEFLAKDGYYDVKKFGFVTSNGSELCPSNNCKYGVENGQFRTNSISGGYVFEGRLKITTLEGDAKKSKFYDFRVDLGKSSEEEKDGEQIQFLEGTFGFGKNKFSPEIEYDITNATYSPDKKSPLLTIQAERSPE